MVAHAADIWCQATGAEYFAGLVRCRSNHWQWRRQAKVPGRVFGEVADLIAGLNQLRQHLTANGHGEPLEITLAGPLVAFVVERDIPHLAAHRVSELACQTVVQVARQQQVMPGGRPDLGLVLGNPVGLGFFSEAVNGGFQTKQFEQPAP